MSVSSTFPARQTLSTKIVGALVGFLILALIAIGATLYLSWQLEGSAAAINETGSLRMRNYRLGMLLSRLPQEATPEHLAARRELQAIDATIALLKSGDPQRPLQLPPSANIRKAFNDVALHWQTGMRPMAAAILEEGSSKRKEIWQAYVGQLEPYVGEVDQLVRLIERDSELRTLWLRFSQLALMAMALGGTVALIYLMFMLIVDPITRLQQGMQRMAEKDFSVRLKVESRDEFGQLTEGFNQMADRLQALYDSLEARVRKKTATLENQNRELALLYDSAAFLQLPQAMEAMCEGFLKRICDYFGADGGSVRVIDPRRNNIHLVAHFGLSQELVESERCLHAGDCLCGEAAEKKVAVVHDLREMKRDHELKCRREGFATVSVFHIHAHGQHIGIFNLHFRAAREFNERENALLETLGQLLGTAIENLRLAMREREMAVSEERNLVAQGLHDSIAQGLTFLNIQVQMLEDSLRNGKVEEAAEIVPNLRAGVQESYEDVRELLLNFRSRLAEDDLTGALKGTVEKFRQQTGIDVRLKLDGLGAPFPREQQLQVLFIVQEALSNIRKHSQAHAVEIRVDDKQDFLLTIQDDGVGFDAAEIEQKGASHVGLHIMRERAQRIHASLDIESAPGMGTTVTLSLPRAQRRAA